MRDLLLLAVQLIITLAKLARPGGVRSVMAESLLLKQQFLISRRSRRRAPSLTTIDRFVLGFMVLFLRPPRVAKLAAVLTPATLLRVHKALVDRKYRHLFSSARTARLRRVFKLPVWWSLSCPVLGSGPDPFWRVARFLLRCLPVLRPA